MNSAIEHCEAKTDAVFFHVLHERRLPVAAHIYPIRGSALSEPAFATSRSDRPSDVERVSDLMARLGVDPLPWQHRVLEVGLEVEDGWPVHRQVIASTGRQNGKSTLLLGLILDRLINREHQVVAYGAQDRLSARSRLLDVWWPAVHGSEFGADFAVSRGMGIESLRYRPTDSVLKILSSAPTSGHGESLDLAVLDEVWSLDLETEQAISPALIARPGSQLWMVSTAGDAKAAWWRSKVEAARDNLAEPGAGAFFEWSAPLDADPADPDVWLLANPAVGHTISLERLEGQYRSMSLDNFRRAHLNQFTEGWGEGWRIIDEGTWDEVTW